MIFKNLVFQRVPKENMYKPHMNGFGDKTLPDFQPISMSPTFKDEFRKDKAELGLVLKMNIAQIASVV